MPGVFGYPGCPGAGKTTQARQAMEAMTGRRRFAIDTGGAAALEDIPLVPTYEALIEEVWGAGRFVRWRPNARTRRAEFEKCMWMVYDAMDVDVLVDDAQKYANQRYCSPALVECCTEWRPRKLGIYITTQRFAWLHQDLMGCITTLKAYRQTSSRDRERLAQEFDMDPERIKALDRGQSEDTTLGFTS